MDSSFKGVGDDPRKCQEGRGNRRHEGRPWRAPYGVGTTVDLILQGSTVDSVGEPPWRQESWGMNGPTPSIIAWSLFFGGGAEGVRCLELCPGWEESPEFQTLAVGHQDEPMKESRSAPRVVLLCLQNHRCPLWCHSAEPVQREHADGSRLSFLCSCVADIPVICIF